MSQQKPRKEGNSKNGLRTAAKFSGIAVQMGLTIYLGNVLGSWLDQKFDKDFLEISVTLFAVFISIFAVIKQANALNK